MPPDANDAGEPKEFRLEGGSLAIAGGVLFALLVGAFQLGRTIERSSAPARTSGTADPLGNVEPEAVDASEKPTFFDTVTGPGKEAEPAREARPKATSAATPQPEVSVSPGPWFVQVFVGRDRQAAEDVVRSLRAKSYPVRIDAVAEGASGSLFKVRVGGFPNKIAAEGVAERLHRDGHSGTWVVNVAP